MGEVDRETLTRFELVMLPHLDAAHNLARWLTRNEHDAVDVVQEAMVRALRGFAGYHGGDARCWLLSVVRNTCLTWLKRNRSAATSLSADAQHEIEADAPEASTILVRADDAERLRSCISDLPEDFREAFVLREIEELSYKQIARVTGVPVGTVMSRLSRARSRLQKALAEPSEE